MPPRPTSPLLLLALSAVLAGCAQPQLTPPCLTPSCPTPPVSGNETEPNDNAAAANALAIDRPLKGRIAGQPRDMDLFKFDAEAGARLKLTVISVGADPQSTLDPYVEVLLPDGFTVLEHDDDSGAELDSELRFNVVTAGTYFVAVTSFRIHDDERAADDRATNTYQLALARR
ncbi:PPC domain-containing protein [Deinococcus arenicola]|uniref:PPC domain-containing protein n=1 Tax=Deinococcus arenicola TaxID=2994950 RepID=A0ABU4DP03_9DEIO|nr:PPC domain-containing protein [Deinococcus sp. ZS9-10]MDV6374098.1 PPC domain-containing protein [Deinococcus sp. ZS9-10]